MQAIHIQSFVAAPLDRIWAALTSRADVLLDGLPARAWPEPRDEQPPFHLHVAWPHTPEPTEVSVTLRELGGGTGIDLVHEGWGEGGVWDEPIQGHFAGWLQGLAALGLLVESGRDARPADPALRGRERYFASGEIPASPSAVYRSLTDPEVLERWSDGVFAGAKRVEALESALVRWFLPAGAATAAADAERRAQSASVVAAGADAAQTSDVTSVAAVADAARTSDSAFVAAGADEAPTSASVSGAAGAERELVIILRRTPRGTHCALAEYGVTDRAASARWPAMFERLARFLV